MFGEPKIHNPRKLLQQEVDARSASQKAEMAFKVFLPGKVRDLEAKVEMLEARIEALEARRRANEPEVRRPEGRPKKVAEIAVEGEIDASMV